MEMGDSAVDSSDDVRVGVFTVRVWAEGPTRELLRARISSALDVATGEPVVTTVVGKDAVLSALAEWLDDFGAA